MRDAGDGSHRQNRREMTYRRRLSCTELTARDAVIGRMCRDTRPIIRAGRDPKIRRGFRVNGRMQRRFDCHSGGADIPSVLPGSGSPDDGSRRRSSCQVVGQHTPGSLSRGLLCRRPNRRLARCDVPCAPCSGISPEFLQPGGGESPVAVPARGAFAFIGACVVRATNAAKYCGRVSQ
jgi:hypothetical protein